MKIGTFHILSTLGLACAVLSCLRPEESSQKDAAATGAPAGQLNLPADTRKPVKLAKPALQLFVPPAGNDSNDGRSADKPFQSLARARDAVRGKVLGASIDALGLNHAEPLPERFDGSGGILELFWDGKRLPLSRWPNEGWTTMKRAVVDGDAKIPGVFGYRDDRPSRRDLNRHLWLKGQWRVPWEEPAIRVAEINTDAHTITFAKAIPQGIGNHYIRPARTSNAPATTRCSNRIQTRTSVPFERLILRNL